MGTTYYTHNTTEVLPQIYAIRLRDSCYSAIIAKVILLLPHGIPIVRIISPWAISVTSALTRRGGLIMRSELILYEYTLYKRPIHDVPIQELRAEEGGGLIIHLGLKIRILRYRLPPNFFICDRLQEKDAFRAKRTFVEDAI